MTSFCTHLNKLQPALEGVKFSSYIREEKSFSKIIGADCVAATPRIKKAALELLDKEIKKKSLPLELKDFPNTNLFKLKLK